MMIIAQVQVWLHTALSKEWYDCMTVDELEQLKMVRIIEFVMFRLTICTCIAYKIYDGVCTRIKLPTLC